MIPLYNGQENHYKNMLDLQEKLRKSEEERIRLEERFNLMVQESRNRHQACINKLRICYVDFLEEQKLREDRNDKLRGTLDKIDTSLVLMTAKTERLNVLRKQYEAYLLRVYGGQRENRSVTADSGLESQNDQEISPSPVFSKTLQTVPKNLLPYINQEADLSKFSPHLDYENTQKLNAMEKSTEHRQNLNTKFTEATTSPIQFENIVAASTNYYSNFPSYLDDAWKYSSFLKANAQINNNNLKLDSRKSPDDVSIAEQDLGNYIEKIKRLHTDLQRNGDNEFDNSFETADYEQNTSGDLLNVTLSENPLPPLVDEEWKKVKSKFRTFRDFVQSNSITSDSKNLTNASSNARDSWAIAFERLSQPDANTDVPRTRIGQGKTEWPSKETIVSKKTDLDEARRLIQQNRELLSKEESMLTEVLKMQKSIEIDNAPDHLFKDENDGCIEDDYDDTVDIDSWMPNDVEQQVQEIKLQDNIQDRLRRKLESIEEVDQPEDEEIKENDVLINTEEVPGFKNEVNEGNVDVSSVNLLKNGNGNANNEEYMSNQEYYAEDGNGRQQQYPDNRQYVENYKQEQSEDEQQYKYANDSNQQYLYDVNGDYENQQYADGQYLNYINQQYQQYDPKQYELSQQYGLTQNYDLNQQYNSNGLYNQNDSNQAYRQFAGKYEKYNDNEQQPDQGSNNEENNINNYDSKSGYDYSQQAQTCVEGNASQSIEILGNDNTLPESNEEQQPIVNYYEVISPNDQVNNYASEHEEESNTGVKRTTSSSLDKPKKKDIIKLILDSDSESFIERNLSNTESDFDFN
ncbi:PREDICTED: GATA zinc finger domain-containing protein 14-like [Ceratosolen solmsi marchali]|uniref:GATA zinc finger domain-containing protein 14-like n=1 Tax=Ceratosolen solmsi marchali TaxID=326594 RepID=A0AAJ7E1E9_9HYME|nr:PREDICTED: GATA zinc finger domain-containing protein 14-like [Ceratosolen solmsi marchali]